MSTRMRSMLLALAVAIPAVGSAQVEATRGGSAPSWLAFDAVSPNPTGLKMAYYVPTTGVAPMPIVVALHGCTGHPSNMLSWLQEQAELRGFMLAMPDVNRKNGANANDNGCWDVGSDDTFANATAADPAERSNSDPVGIYALVQYVGTTLMCEGEPCGDLGRVFATGQSSGAMMTNVLLGLYPDVLTAGASFMGVPYGCWLEGVRGAHPVAGSEGVAGGVAGWSSLCADGKVEKSPEAWAALLPPYGGTRPRVMIWHGEKDDLIYPKNFEEAVEQWTEALGVRELEPSKDYPLGSWSNGAWTKVWTRSRYGGTDGQPAVEAISISNLAHSVEPQAATAAELVRFFGLGDSTAPAVPTNLSFSNVGAGGATLAWDAPTDDVGVTNYVVYRVEGETLTPIAWPAATPFAMKGLTPSTSYALRVAAVDLAGNVSAPSAEGETITFTTTADTTPPSAPASFAAQNLTATGARLRWNAATDDVAVTGYVISRQDGEAWTVVKTQPERTLDLTGLEPSTGYTYRVVATDAAGHESAPSTVTFTTLSSGGGGGGGGGGCGQGVPSGAALILAAAAWWIARRRVVRG